MSQLGSDKALAGDAVGQKRGDLGIKDVPSNHSDDIDTGQCGSQMIKNEKGSKSNAVLTTGPRLLSTILKQAGNTALAAGLGPTSLR